MDKATPRKRPTERPDHDAPSAPGAEPVVYIVDDDAAMRESLAYLVQSGGWRTETFDSAEAFLQHDITTVRGCVLLDVRMPGMNGLELQEYLQRQDVRVPVIIVTAHADVPMAVRAMRAGAFDFIEKPCNDKLLLDRIRQAVAFDAQRSIDEARQREIRQRVDALSDRERQVMELVVDGYLNKQIADQLSISIKTVEVHRSRVMDKMQADGLADLVRMATAVGFG